MPRKPSAQPPDDLKQPYSKAKQAELQDSRRKAQKAILLAQRVATSGRYPPGKVLRHIREFLGLSQVDVARICGCSDQAISYYELNRRRPGVRISRELELTLGIPRDAWYDDPRPGERLPIERRARGSRTKTLGSPLPRHPGPAMDRMEGMSTEDLITQYKQFVTGEVPSSDDQDLDEEFREIAALADDPAAEYQRLKASQATHDSEVSRMLASIRGG